MAGVGPEAPRHVTEGKTLIDKKTAVGDAATPAGQGQGGEKREQGSNSVRLILRSRGLVGRRWP